jgi:hypothetical protein
MDKVKAEEATEKVLELLATIRAGKLPPKLDKAST